MLRLWAIVLTANLLGAFLFTLALSEPIFPVFVLQAFREIGAQAMQPDFFTHCGKGVFSGWMIALMVWLLPSAEGSKVAIIVILTYVVALGGFSHIVAGSVEALYLARTGAIGYGDYLVRYAVPTLLGNIVGEVSLVAALNHAQVVAGKQKK
jgi:formate-nitrite transporter family protein